MQYRSSSAIVLRYSFVACSNIADRISRSWTGSGTNCGGAGSPLTIRVRSSLKRATGLLVRSASEEMIARTEDIEVAGTTGTDGSVRGGSVRGGIDGLTSSEGLRLIPGLTSRSMDDEL